MSNANPQIEMARLALAALTPGDRAAVIREHATPEPERPASLRLFRMGEAAAATGLSRCTIWRAVRESRLRAVEIRKGRLRIPERALRAFVEGRPA